MPKTITSEALARLAFCNSPKLPHVIVVLKPRRMQWVGIGWIDCGEPKGDEVVVIEDGATKIQGKQIAVRLV